MDKADYEYKLHKVVYRNFLKRELDRSGNEYYWQKQILEEIMWFHFQDILEHVANHSKGLNILIH